MVAILKSGAKAHAAVNFLDNFYDAGGTDRIYIGLAAPAEWSPDPGVPDTPINSYDEENSFWGNLVGAGEVAQGNDTELVIPRNPWVTAVATFAIYNDATASGAGTFIARDFYVTNLEANPKVYACTIVGGGNTANEPTHTNPAGVTGGDGYRWEYLFTIGSGEDVSAALLSDSWMPVPTANSTTAWVNSTLYAVGDVVADPITPGKLWQTTAGGTSSGTGVDDDVGVTDWAEVDFAQRLGGFFVACSLAFPDFAGTGNKIANTAYRQVSLLRNPIAVGGGQYAAQWAAPADLEAQPVTRGIFLTLDNRTTLTRALGQTETVRLILEF
jgi:hypothetical protein